MLRFHELSKSWWNWLAAFLCFLINFFFFLSYIKISNDSSAKYYQKNKERLQKKPVKDIEVFLKKKEKKQYGRERYKNLTENEKQILAEYRRKHKMRKGTLL